MGAWNQFVCEVCGYEAEVSGGDDFGFRAFTTTVFCQSIATTALAEPLPPILEGLFPELHTDGVLGSSMRKWRISPIRGMRRPPRGAGIGIRGDQPRPAKEEMPSIIGRAG